MSESATIPEKEEKTDNKTKRQPPYNVILLNDDYHTVEYVILLCKKVFGYSPEKGFEIAKEVHEKNRCILWTGPLEVAELKRDQIHAIGKDNSVKNCKGSMSAVLEPAA